MEITIPAYDANAALVAGKNPTIIEIVGQPGQETLEIRNCGANKVYLHEGPPSAAGALKGYPLGANATDNELGEGRSVGGRSNGATKTIYITAQSASKVRVLAV